jgi:hypothetical protein
MAASGMKHPVVWQKFTDVIGVLAASIIRVTQRHDDGGSKYLCDVGTILPDATT